MNAKYSKITGGVYPLSVYQSFPADALDIPVAIYDSFKNGEISGFDVDANGLVIERVAQAPTLDQLKSDKNAAVKLAANLAIVDGITYDALGTAHTYPTSLIDQQNINGLITETLLPGSGDEYKFWCADAAGVWARRIHTKLQIQAVGIAVANHVKSSQEIYEQQLIAIDAAVSQAELDLI